MTVAAYDVALWRAWWRSHCMVCKEDRRALRTGAYLLPRCVLGPRARPAAIQDRCSLTLLPAADGLAGGRSTTESSLGHSGALAQAGPHLRAFAGHRVSTRRCRTRDRHTGAARKHSEDRCIRRPTAVLVQVAQPHCRQLCVA